VAFSAGGDGGKKAPELPARFTHAMGGDLYPALGHVFSLVGVAAF